MKRVQRVFGDIDALRYVDDRLDEDRRTAFQRHLATDPDQSNRVQLWSRQNEALRGAFAGTAAEPVPLWLRLDQLTLERDEARADQPGSNGLASERAPHPRVARFVPPPAEKRRGGRFRAVATAVVLVAAGGLAVVAARTLLPSPALTSEMRGTDMADDDPIARAVDAFHTFALDPTHPVEMTALDQPGLERWLSRRAGLPVRAPDLREQGWTLLGGRTTPGEAGPAAFLVYDGGDGRRLGLYVARASGTGRTGIETGSTPEGSTLSWTSGPASYVVVADKDESWMGWNASALKARIQAGSTP